MHLGSCKFAVTAALLALQELEVHSGGFELHLRSRSMPILEWTWRTVPRQYMEMEL